jgi:hypothetical protein
MAHIYDPAKGPCDPKFYYCVHEGQPCIAGPGGNTTLIENNEKGMLETEVFKVIARHQQAALGSNHDSQKQGIYATNSVGDND